MTEETPPWLTVHPEGEGARERRKAISARQFYRELEGAGYRLGIAGVVLIGATIASASEVPLLEDVSTEFLALSAGAMGLAALVTILGGRAGRSRYNDL